MGRRRCKGSKDERRVHHSSSSATPSCPRVEAIWGSISFAACLWLAICWRSDGTGRLCSRKSDNKYLNACGETHAECWPQAWNRLLRRMRLASSVASGNGNVTMRVGARSAVRRNRLSFPRTNWHRRSSSFPATVHKWNKYSKTLGRLHRDL